MTLFATASLVSPAEPLAGQLRAAIWSDLQLNAMIGNGNWLASLWYNAGEDNSEAEPLHIQNISCVSSHQGYQCAFTLLRDGGVRVIFNEVAPARLTCNAQFVKSGTDGWEVKHLPLHGAGHSRTTMQCTESH
ncbi:hypothetical protein [Asticcacaulis taihuensis]|uniref:hypothetical protein n=1 Tax=Asticcacaulis taihuensis TaxID=260084 RepID=UPI0026F21F35|nr:hypothetical protein [Asticcacaulis taihuensis]